MVRTPLVLVWPIFFEVMISEHSMCYVGEQGMVDEAHKALEEAEALTRVDSFFLLQLIFQFLCHILCLSNFSYLINMCYVAPACAEAGACYRGFREVYFC